MIRNSVRTVSIIIMITGSLPAGALLTEQTLAEESGTQGVEIGLNSFLGNLGESEIRGPLIRPSPADRSNYLDAVRDLGANTIRETFLNWADIEPVRGGGYLLEPYDDLAKKASERGIEIVALAFPFPDWATGAEKTPPDRLFTRMYLLPKREFEADFRKVVSTFVKRYSGQHPESLPMEVPIRRWIFSNELDYFADADNVTVLGPDPDEYAYWLHVFWEEIKKTDPGASVVTMGFENPVVHLKFLNNFLDSENLQGKDYPYFDVLAFHCYPKYHNLNIYVMNADEAYIQRSLQKRGLEKPIWLMETGDNSIDESIQAYQWMKFVLHGASLGVPRVHFHGLWDIGARNNWGVLANSPSGELPRRKPSFTAAQILLDMLKGNRGVDFLGPGRYRVAMPGGKSVYVLWSEEPNTDVGAFFHEEDLLLVTTLQNVAKKVTANELELSVEPVFVEVVR